MWQSAQWIMVLYSVMVGFGECTGVRICSEGKTQSDTKYYTNFSQVSLTTMYIQYMQYIQYIQYI